MAKHTLTSNVVAATDEADGYTEWTCDCGYTYKDTLTQKTYGITFEGNDLAYAIGLPTEAKLGAEVEFKVTVESGYEAVAVTASYGTGENETAVELTGSVSEGYKFTMPAQAVIVKAEARGAYFIAEPTDAEAVVVTPQYTGASNKKISDFIAGFYSDGRKTTGQTLYARAGSEVYILANYVAKAADVKYFMNDVELEETTYRVVTKEAQAATDDTPAVEEQSETYRAYKFIMPAKNAVLNVTAVERAFELKVNAPDYVTTMVYTLDDLGEKQEVTTAKGGDLIYLSVALDADHQDGNYKISGVTYSFEELSGYIVKKNDEDYHGSTSNYSMTARTEGELYTYSVSTYSNIRETITLNVGTLEAQYKNEDFVGSFAGAEWYSNFTKFGSFTATANGFGEFELKGSWNTNKYYVLAKENTDAYKRLSFATSAGGAAAGAYMYYDANVLLINYYSTRAENFSDFYFLLKGVTSASDITWEYQGNNLNDDADSVGYIVAKDADGNELGNALKIYRDIYLNVTITLDEGSTDIATGNFSIMKGGKEIAHHTHVEAE